MDGLPSILTPVGRHNFVKIIFSKISLTLPKSFTNKRRTRQNRGYLEKPKLQGSCYIDIPELQGSCYIDIPMLQVSEFIDILSKLQGSGYIDIPKLQGWGTLTYLSYRDLGTNGISNASKSAPLVNFKLELRIVLLPLTSPTLCTGFYIRNYQGYRYCSSKNFMRHKMKISEHN